jgi:two-component sensor histidine kinase
MHLRSLFESRLSRRVRWLAAGALFTIATILTANALVLVQAHQSALSNVETNLLRESLSLSELTDRTLQAVDLVLASVADRIRMETSPSGNLRKLGDQKTNQFLKEKLSELPQINSLGILDENGNRVNQSRGPPYQDADLSDREYFQALKKNPGMKAFIGEPVQGRTSGTWVIIVARPVLSETGDLLGVVYASIVLQYFEDLFRATSIGDGYAATLRRDDGTLLARYPAAGQIGTAAFASAINRMGRSGVGRAIGPSDHQARVGAAHRLAHFPLIVIATQTESAAFAMWRSILISSLLISLFLVGIVLTATYLIARSWKQQDQLNIALAEVAEANSSQALAEVEMDRQKDLAEHAARFNSAVENMPHGLCMYAADQRLIVCNRRYREMYGLTDDQTNPGTTLQSILEARATATGSPRDADAYVPQRLRLFDRGKPHYVEDLLNDGRIIAVSNQLMPDGGWVSVHQDITELMRAAQHQALLISELDHRVKNTLARISVVANYTRHGSHSMDELVHALDNRIQSLADAHVLLSQNHWHGVAVADLVRRQLAPYTTETNVEIGGPDVVLSPTATQALAMVLQELVTNALKYGSLSVPAGKVSVSWNRRASDEGPPRMVIAWREIGGPPVKAPAQASYGTNLIRDLIPHELGGAVELVFAPEGLRCDIEIPLDERIQDVSTKLAS